MKSEARTKNFPVYDLPERLPPRLTMEEYIDFVEESLRHADPKKVALLKKMEKDIRTPFAKVSSNANTATES